MRLTRNVFAVVLAMCPAILSVADGAPVRFLIEPDEKSTLVRFDSKAPLESFSGTTHHATGKILVDPAGPTDSIVVQVEVELASLETGIALRDQHMRDNHLETEKHPTASFRGARIVGNPPERFTPGEPMQLEIEGLFLLHGVERRIRIPVTVTYHPADEQLEIESRFSLLLSDYSIPRPQFLLLKVGDEQKVTFRARARRAE